MVPMAFFPLPHFKALGKWRLLAVMLTQPRKQSMKANKQTNTDM